MPLLEDHNRLAGHTDFQGEGSLDCIVGAAVLGCIDLVAVGSIDLEEAGCIDLAAGLEERSILAGSLAALAGTAGLAGDLAANFAVAVDTAPEEALGADHILQLAGTVSSLEADHSLAVPDSTAADMALNQCQLVCINEPESVFAYAAVHRAGLDSTTYFCLRYLFHTRKRKCNIVSRNRRLKADKAI